MGLMTQFRKIKNVFNAIAEHDGRGKTKVVTPYEPTEEEKQARAAHAIRVAAAKNYMTQRGRLAVVCPEFTYVPANATDIRATMRAYIEETMPEVKDSYRFLFTDAVK